MPAACRASFTLRTEQLWNRDRQGAGEVEVEDVIAGGVHNEDLASTLPTRGLAQVSPQSPSPHSREQGVHRRPTRCLRDAVELWPVREPGGLLR